jgi:Domain of unknown function (DUF6468)
VSTSFGFLIECLVAILLAFTICYCVILNHRLKRLKADERALKATIGELIKATEIAERAVTGLKQTARECEDTLGERLRAAERYCGDLTRQMKSGEMILDRLARVVVVARPLGDAPAAVSSPNPQAVAAAARSLSDRLRERLGVLAA